MGMGVGGDKGLQSDINVTPLVDVVLVLLIIFIVIVPATMRGYDVDIPSDAVISEENVRKLETQMILSIDGAGCPAFEPPPAAGLPADCNVRLNEETLEVASLSTRVNEAMASRAVDDRVLFLAAAEQLNYEAVMRIVDSAKANVDGLRIGIVTEN